MFETLPIDGKEIQKKVSYQEILKLRIFPTDNIPKPEAVLFFYDQMAVYAFLCVFCSASEACTPDRPFYGSIHYPIF